MLILYRTMDSANVINKTLYRMKDFPIKLKEKFSLSSPSINLRITDDFPIHECNYCYLEEFNRYYFIHDIQLLSDDVYKLVMECDVLESFKADILNSRGEIEKRVDVGDYSQFSTTLDVRKDIDIYESTKSVDGVKYIILSTIGG